MHYPTNEESAPLLAAILDDPQEDGPRLTFADWLETECDPRGEFLRIQCALGHLDEDDPRRDAIERREAELLEQHGEDWLGRPPEDMEVHLRRGLLSLRVKAEVMARDPAPPWFLAYQDWVSELQLDDAEDPSLQRVVARGLLTQVAVLRFRYHWSTEARPNDGSMKHLGSQRRLRVLDLDDTPVTDAGLGHLTELSELRELILSGTRVTDAGLACLAGMTRLRVLRLDGTVVTDAGLRSLAGLTRMQELGLSGTEVADTGLESLVGHTGLRRLDLDATLVTDAGLRHLAGLTQLQELDLTCTGVTGTGLEHLAALTQLRVLRLWDTSMYLGHVPEPARALQTGQWRELGRSSTDLEVSEDQLKHLAGLTHLQELQLCHSGIGDAGLKHLAGLTGLRILDLEQSEVTDTGLEHLAGLTELRKLCLDHTPVSGAGLRHLVALTRLRLLKLHRTEVTDAGLGYLSGLTQLKELWLHGTEVTDAGVEKLQQALPGCSICYLGMP